MFFGCLVLGLASTEYVPGTPGAPWTQDEVLVVKAKLFAIFHRDGGCFALDQMYDGINYNCKDYMKKIEAPNAAKMLRLGFHDCLKYSDGTGGCDGCLNWKGVGTRLDSRKGHFKFYYDNVTSTNNNGLGKTVEVLERIYTDPKFPRDAAPYLNVSLKASGKSRADLWAFAAIAAVEHGIQTNNMVCDGTQNGNPQHQCNQWAGTPDCKVVLPRPIQFKTGRKDCIEVGDLPYKATKPEVQPWSVGNGKKTIDFFTKNFNFSGRDTVAIFGAHTMGRLHFEISMYRYTWVNKGESSFNNHYYK